MNNERAFPTYHGGYAKCDADGMTLRDYFAARAMQGFFERLRATQFIPYDQIAEDAYRVANAMMKARELK